MRVVIFFLFLNAGQGLPFENILDMLGLFKILVFDAFIHEPDQLRLILGKSRVVDFPFLFLKSQFQHPCLRRYLR